VNLPDVRDLSVTAREAAALRLRTLRDFDLPELHWFNTDPCSRHDSLDHGANQIPPCRACGIRFRKHQRVGIAWLWVRGKGLIADQVGTGKTAQAAGLMAALKQTGDLSFANRAIVVCRPAAVEQWQQELQRFLPRVPITAVAGARKQRVERYLHPWEVLVTNQHLLVNDREQLEMFNLAVLVVDDIDPLRNPQTQTAYAIKRIAGRAERVAVLTATPLQKRLHEIHSVLEPVGGYEVFGSLTRFRRDYVREELVNVYNKKLGRMVKTKKIVGYQHLDDFKTKLVPLTLRRTADDIDDVDLPVISPPNNVYLDLHPAQRQRYDDLRKGVRTLIKAEGELVKRTTATTAWINGAKICAGLGAIGEPDGPGASVKLDWVIDHVVDGDLAEEKVVVFCHFQSTVESLGQRLTDAGVGHVLIWGRENDRTVRQRNVSRFWDDPTCRVLIGTEAIEQSLNLQVSRHLINVDQLLNPARMQQLAGRIRRDGSAFRTVYVHNLLARHTHEEGLLDLLSREQAMADHVWGESNQLYDALSPLALLEMIGQS